MVRTHCLRSLIRVRTERHGSCERQRAVRYYGRGGEAVAAGVRVFVKAR